MKPLLLLMLLCPALAIAMPSAPLAATTTTAPPVESSSDAVPTPEQILAIPPALRTLLQEQVIAPGTDRQARLQRLVTLLFDQQALDLRYDASANASVSEVWALRRANCMAFSLFFVRLAREAGIHAQVQEVDQVVSWFENAGAVYSVGHVNVGIRINGQHATVDLDRNVLYGPRGPRPISDARALAHFYNNRGAQEMDAGHSALARRYFDAALSQDPAFALSWNNRGVLDARHGLQQQARSSFQQALQLEPDNVAALVNASALLQRMGQPQQARRLQQRLAQVQRTDPFVQYMQGTEAENRGDLGSAIRHYRRAVRLYDKAHPFHFGLARVYFLSGRLSAADAELRRAQALADGSARDRYQDKLESLQRWRQHHANATGLR